MIIEIEVPAAGESVTEATVGSLLVENGSFVNEDDPILELETDKANLPLNAPKSGTVEILVNEGDDVTVGQVIVKLNTSGEGSTPSAAPAAKEEPKAEKATSEAKAPAAAPAPAPKEKGPSTPKVASSSPTIVIGKKNTSVAPAAKKIMEEKGISPLTISGSGKGGRITKSDVIQQIKNPSPNVGFSAAGFPPPPNINYVASEPEPIQSANETRKKMSRLRRVIAKKLVDAKNETAMLTTFNEVNMARVMNLRGQYKDRFKETHGVNLGFMSFFIKACTDALKAYPEVNAYIDGEDIIYRNYFDISVAVGTPRGLVVPVLRATDKMSFYQIEAKIRDFALRGKDGTLEISEMEGGGFTISNGGVYGSMLSTPILNAPQSAVLGMHNIQERPIVEDGKIVIAPIMYLALSYDHRIIDGKEAVSFLVKVKNLIEDPAGLLFEV